MNRPKLSICIPTYNRAEFLKLTLRRFAEEWKFPFAIEINISDNASTDDTAEVIEKYKAIGLPITSRRQPETVPMLHHLQRVRRSARGEYVLHLSDDDILIPEEVTRAVVLMDQVSSAIACFCAVENYDDVDGEALGTSFRMDQDMVARKGELPRMFDFIVMRGVRPEIAIYRAEAMAHLGVPRKFCFGPYADLAHLILHGDVIFVGRPFYRLVLRSPAAPAIQHSGVEVAKLGWDCERGGLEELFITLADAGGVTFTRDEYLALSQSLDIAELSRMVVAMRLWLNRGEYLRAYELYMRSRLTLRRWGLAECDFPELEEVKRKMRGLVEVRAAVEVAGEVGAGRIHLVGAAAAWQPLLHPLGLKEEVEVRPVPHADALETPGPTDLAIVEHDAERAATLSRGYAAGMVIDRETLLRRYHVPD